MDPVEEIAALRARIADIERRAAAPPPDPSASMEGAVQKHYEVQAERARLRALKQAAAGWQRNAAFERAIALRESGPEGRAMVEQAYRGSWDLAAYQDGKRATAELAEMEKENQ